MCSWRVNLSAFGGGGKAKGTDSKKMSKPWATNWRQAWTVCPEAVWAFNSRFNLNGT